jgi:hypothetical protein
MGPSILYSIYCLLRIQSDVITTLRIADRREEVTAVPLFNYSPRGGNVLSCVRVTIDGVWIGNLIYEHLQIVITSYP